MCDDAITALGATGFTVRTSANVNTNGRTYHYAAWKAVAGEMSVGSYVGNNADNRNITGVGFQPESVITRGIGALFGAYHPASLGIAVDLAVPFVNFGSSANGIQAL